MERRLTKFYHLKKWFFCLFLFFFFFNFSVVLTKECSLGICSEAGRGRASRVLRARSGWMWCPPDGALLVDTLEPPSSPRGSWEPCEGLLAPQERPSALSLFLKHVFAGRLELDRLEGIICSFQSIFLCLTSRYGRRPAFICEGGLHLSESVTSEKLPGPGPLGCGFQLPAAERKTPEAG